MLNEWVKFLLACMAVLAVVVLGTSNIKIPGPGLTASVTDFPTEPGPADSVPADSVPADSVPADSAPAVPTEPVSATIEPATAEPTGVPVFQEILQVFLPPLFTENPAPIPAAPKGVSRFKVLIVDQDTLESKVNDWLTVQQNIVIDQLNVQDYGGGGYLVVISYHPGGTGNSLTRLKLIAGENPEADAEAFLSLLGASQTVRSIAATTGSYSGPEKTVVIPLILIVYE